MNIGQLGNKIATIAMNANQAADPVNIMFGTVVSTNPLKININQKMDDLDEDFFVLAESLSEIKITIGESEYLIRRGLESDDRVLLLKMQGGQQYVVLDRVI